MRRVIRWRIVEANPSVLVQSSIARRLSAALGLKSSLRHIRNAGCKIASLGLCPKKGVWNSPASINAGVLSASKFQTPFFGPTRIVSLLLGTESRVLSLFGHAFARTEITRRPGRRSRHRIRAPLVFQVATHELGGGLQRDRGSVRGGPPSARPPKKNGAAGAAI